MACDKWGVDIVGGDNNMKPNMANGSIVPHSVLEQQIKEAKEKELRKQQWRHDFRVALFSAVVGGFTGFLATVITQMLL
jgi:hypothetical protein